MQRTEWINPELSATAFVDFATQWLATRSHLKPGTFEGYESLLRVHILPTFGTTRLDRIDTMSIEAWIAELRSGGLSASRTRQAHQVLSRILAAAVKARYLPSNPAVEVKLPRLPRREQLFLEPHEVVRLADAMSDHFRALVYIFAYGGLRWGEAVALRR